MTNAIQVLLPEQVRANLKSYLNIFYPKSVFIAKALFLCERSKLSLNKTVYLRKINNSAVISVNYT
jgi:hypothetical protein